MEEISDMESIVENCRRKAIVKRKQIDIDSAII